VLLNSGKNVATNFLELASKIRCFKNNALFTISRWSILDLNITSDVIVHERLACLKPQTTASASFPMI